MLPLCPCFWGHHDTQLCCDSHSVKVFEGELPGDHDIQPANFLETGVRGCRAKLIMWTAP